SAGSLRRAHPHASVSALAIGEREQTLGTSNAPTNQLHVGTLFRRLVRSLSLRPFWLLASWADRTREGLLPQPSLGLYVRAFSSRVTPRTAGYDYGAQWGIAPTGLPPVSTVASLAALPPVGPSSDVGCMRRRPPRTVPSLPMYKRVNVASTHSNAWTVWPYCALATLWRYSAQCYRSSGLLLES